MSAGKEETAERRQTDNFIDFLLSEVMFVVFNKQRKLLIDTVRFSGVDKFCCLLRYWAFLSIWLKRLHSSNEVPLLKLARHTDLSCIQIINNIRFNMMYTAALGTCKTK